MARRVVIWFALVFMLISAFSTVGAAPIQDINVKEFLAKYEKAVVFITTYDDKGRKTSTGSGFFVSADGLLVTNRHVLKGSMSAEIEGPDGSKYKVKRVVATQPDLDLVTAEVDTMGKQVPFLNVEPEVPAKGDKVVVLGSPLGYKFSFSEGAVAGVRTLPDTEHRELTGMKGDYIQFTAPVSPGSSGGPVLNAEGKVIGVVTWGYISSSAQNLNFAVPGKKAYELMKGNNPLTSTELAAPNEGLKRANILIMYGPKALAKLKDEEKQKKLSDYISESITAKFRPNKYLLTPYEKTAAYFQAYWKIKDLGKKPPTMEDIDKDVMLGFAEQQMQDFMIFAGLELLTSKGLNTRDVDINQVEIELDLRILDTSRKSYAYSRTFDVEGQDFYEKKVFVFERGDMIKAIEDAVARAIRAFRKDFSTDQLI